MKHIDSVEPAGSAPDVTLPEEGWEASWGSAGWSVSGPCPACRGDAWGPPIPAGVADDAGERNLVGPGAPPASGAVLAACYCGRTHGDSEGSCGRRWVVRI